MEWGDYIEDNDFSDGAISSNLELLRQQALESFPILEQIDRTKPYKIGWYIKQ